MRRESLFFGILTLVVSAFLTGCSDDDTEVYVPQRVAEFNLSDESDGNRLFIIHPWEGEIAIPVHDDRIRDFEFSGKYFDWEMRQGAESRFLVLNLKKEVERKPFLEKIALRGIPASRGRRRRTRSSSCRNPSWKAQRRITPRAICTTWARR